MNRQRFLFRKIIISFQTVCILFMMLLLFAAIGYIIFGREGISWAIVAGAVVFFISPRLSPGLMLRMYNARVLSPAESPELYRAVAELSERAGLASVPQLYYIPSRMMNAFTVGNKRNSAVAFTDGLLRRLTWRELFGVMAHEVSHIEHNDLWIMNLADTLSRITHIFSSFGIFLLILYLPLILIAGYDIPFFPIIILLFAPTLSVLLQLSLSRTREFDADISAVKLTGDPSGLASALQKIEHYPLKIWEMIFMPGRKVPSPSILRTHPHSEKRIRRLMELSERDSHSSYTHPANHISIIPADFNEYHENPRWRIHGLWK